MSTLGSPSPVEPLLWIISPVLFDVTSFRQLRDRLRSQFAEGFPTPARELRFVVIDDSAGADLEMDDLARLTDVQVITPPFNLGHQRAIVFGLRVVAAELGDHDYVVTMDADGEDRPEDVGRLLEGLAEEGDRLEMGALALRVQRTESVGLRILYAAFRVLFRTLTGTRIRTGNFAAQRGWFIRNALFHPSFDLCYSTSLLALRRPRVFVPCDRGTRYAGESRMHTYSLVAHGVRMMLPFAEQIAVRILIASLAFGAIAGLSGAAFLVAALTDADWSTGAGVAFLGSLILTLVSFTGFLALFAGSAHSSALGMQGLDPSRG